jgi:MYXO-CTERM domain-containing protein
MTVRVLFALAIAAAAVAAPAWAKEGVVATLEEPVALDAPPGEEVALAWTLALVGEDGTEQPFEAQGVFITLVSAAGGEPSTGYAEGGSSGRYTATALVPAGGIGGIQIALMGWANGEPAPLAFPIANSPFPDVGNGVLIPPTDPDATAPATQPPAESESAGAPAWMVIGLAALLALGIAVFVLRRRRPLSSA